MPNVRYAAHFAEDVAAIYSSRVLTELDRRLAAIEAFPCMGSEDLPESLVLKFGPGIRRFPVPPFVIVYRYIEEDDLLEFLALPYDKTVE